MSRMARFLKDEVCYYVRSQSYRKQKIFKTKSDYEQYIRLLKKYKVRYQVNVYGYCLLSMEVYLIIHPSNSKNLPCFMQGLQQSYALYFNTRYNKAGKVWRQRFKSDLINNDSALVKCIKLVEFIPVQRYRSLTPMQYAWSSCSMRVLGSDKIVDSIPPEGPVLSENL